MTAPVARLARREPEVLVAASAAEAVAMFGDGSGVTVVGGGTVLAPSLTHGTIWPERVLLLHAAGLDGIRDGDPLEVGATATLARLAAVAPEPLAAAARIPDYEIRGQATVGGNVLSGGDLQAALIVLGARVPLRRRAGRAPGARRGLPCGEWATSRALGRGASAARRRLPRGPPPPLPHARGPHRGGGAEERRRPRRRGQAGRARPSRRMPLG